MTTRPVTTPTPRWVARVPSYAGAGAIVLAVLMLVGWSRQFATLHEIAPSLPMMKANSSVAVFFAGASLMGRRPGCRWLTLVPLAIALATLVEWINGQALGIDELLVHDTFAAHAPGRPSPQMAGAMTCFSLARLLSGGRSLDRLGAIATAAYGCLVLVLELGWIFHAPELASLDRGPGLAFPSAVCIAVLALGLAALHAERRPLAYLWDTGPAGTVVRHVLPWVLIAPPTLGLVPVLAHNLNLGVAAYAGSMMLLLAVVVTVTAQSIHVLEADRLKIARELEAIFDSVPAAMTMRDPQGRLLRYNRAGATAADGRAIDPDAARPPLVAATGELSAHEAAALEGQRPVTRAYGPTSDGSEYEITKFPVFDVDGSVLGIGGFALDVTARSRAERALREAEQRARQLADRDPLTGIWNRRWFEAELRAVLAHLPGTAPRGALFVVDVDHFKAINDTAGHPAGDQLLIAVARALADSVADAGSVSRIGGDEFAVIMTRGDREAVEATAARIVAAVHAAGRRVSAVPISATASVGVARFADLAPADRTGLALLLRADEAMYAAKRGGRGRHLCYGPELARGA